MKHCANNGCVSGCGVALYEATTDAGDSWDPLCSDCLAEDLESLDVVIVSVDLVEV